MKNGSYLITPFILLSSRLGCTLELKTCMYKLSIMIFTENSFSELLISFAALLLGLHYLRSKPLKRLPPGPTPLPLIGNALQIGRKPHLVFTKWAEIYGPIFKIKMGPLDAIVINDAKLIKELFSDISSSGRMHNPVTLEFSKGHYGVINGEGEPWEAQRRFTLRKLRDFGFAKTSMEGMILDEVKAMMEWFRERENTFISGNRIFTAPVLNSLYHIVTGERCEWETGQKQDVLVTAEKFFESFVQVTPLMFAPFMRHIAPRLSGWTKFVENVDRMIEIFEDSIDKHKKILDPGNPKDFIDHMLVEINGTTDPKSSFYKETGHKHLVAGVFDLFEAGSETSSHTLSWSLLFLSTYKKVQDKLQAEIDSIIGSSRLPCLADRAKMPYAEAVIAELLRRSDVLGLGVPHRMVADKEFHGFLLPKGSAIFSNIYACHHNPLVWENSFDFNPERFLNEDGTKYVKKEGLIPFSGGKRECIGASLAKDTLFLFIITIFQQFCVLPEDRKQVDFEAADGLFHIPQPFKVKMVPRDGY